MAIMGSQARISRVSCLQVEHNLSTEAVSNFVDEPFALGSAGGLLRAPDRLDEIFSAFYIFKYQLVNRLFLDAALNSATNTTSAYSLMQGCE